MTANITMRKLIILFIQLLFLFLCEHPVLAQQPSIIEQMIRIKPALVEITADNVAATLKSPRQRSLFKDPQTGKIVILERGAALASYQRNGAGVIIDPSGIIATNAHTIFQADQITILLSTGATLKAQVVRFAKDLDLALLKINAPSPLPAVRLADSSQILLNQEIFSVGSSPLLKESISGGKITGLASSRNARYSNADESDFFQTSLNIYHGDSGGPLFNRSGELVGLMTAKLLSRDNSSFAISSNKIRRYLDACLNDAKAQK